MLPRSRRATPPGQEGLERLEPEEPEPKVHPDEETPDLQQKKGVGGRDLGEPLESFH